MPAAVLSLNDLFDSRPISRRPDLVRNLSGAAADDLAEVANDTSISTAKGGAAVIAAP